jgi:hypothetical protein
MAFCRGLYQEANVCADDRAFCRVATIFGEQCNWLIADSMSKIPERSKFATDEAKFTYVFAQLENQMQTRIVQTPNCAEE